MSIWFKGYIEVQCTLSKVKTSLDDHGQYFLHVIGNMPGLKDVELIEEGDEFSSSNNNVLYCITKNLKQLNYNFTINKMMI